MKIIDQFTEVWGIDEFPADRLRTAHQVRRVCSAGGRKSCDQPALSVMVTCGAVRLQCAKHQRVTP